MPLSSPFGVREWRHDFIFDGGGQRGEHQPVFGEQHGAAVEEADDEQEGGARRGPGGEDRESGVPGGGGGGRGDGAGSAPQQAQRLHHHLPLPPPPRRPLRARLQAQGHQGARRLHPRHHLPLPQGHLRPAEQVHRPRPQRTHLPLLRGRPAAPPRRLADRRVRTGAAARRDQGEGLARAGVRAGGVHPGGAAHPPFLRVPPQLGAGQEGRPRGLRQLPLRPGAQGGPAGVQARGGPQGVRAPDAAGGVLPGRADQQALLLQVPDDLLSRGHREDGRAAEAAGGRARAQPEGAAHQPRLRVQAEQVHAGPRPVAARPGQGHPVIFFTLRIRKASDHVERPSCALEGLHAPAHLLLRVPRAQLHADPRLALRHHREAEPDHEDVLLQHAVRQLSRHARVAQPHRRDRTAVVPQDAEPRRLHRAAEQRGVGVELRDQRAALLEQLVGLEGGPHDGGSDGVREEVGARPVPEHVHHLAARRHESPRGPAHRLPQRAADEVDLAVQSEQLGSALAGLSDEAGSVALVDVDVGVVLLRELVDPVEGGDIAVHGEDAVSDDDSHARLLRLLELLLEVGHVQVLEAVLLGLAEPDAVDDRGVVEGVADHCVLGPEDGLEEPGVGVEAAGEEDGVLERVVVRDHALELLVDVLGAADEAHRAHAEAVRVEGALGGLHEARAVGEAEVVVRAEVEHRLPVGRDLGELRRGDHPLRFVGPRFLHRLDLLRQVLLDELADLPAHLQSRTNYPDPNHIILKGTSLFRSAAAQRRQVESGKPVWGIWGRFGVGCIINKTMNITGRIETPQQILNHPANTSSAKHHWSFSKAARFPNAKAYTATISYNLPSSVSKRKPGIGYGDRSKNFEGSSITPSPCKYQSQSEFARRERRGYSFGANREDLKYANYLKQMEHTPSAYALNESQVRSARSYSMRPKTAYPKNYFIPNNEETNRLKEFPGPGKYESIDMIGSGKDFYNSKHKTQKQKSFNGGDRFHNQKQTPGPSDYTITNTIEPDGIYFLSNMKSSGRRPILAQKRELQLAGNKQTPGPVYERPSDFGHYDRPTQRPRTARN